MDYLEKELLFDEFCEEFPFCWSCGWNPHYAIHRWHVPKLDIHHSLGGPNRIHDRRNLARLCAGCHRLAHGDRLRDSLGDRIPALSRSNIFWLKRERDRDFYDPMWYELRGSIIVPKLERPDPWFDKQYRHYRKIPSWRP